MKPTAKTGEGKPTELEDNEATRFMRKVYALRGTTPEAYIAEVEWASKLIAAKLKETADLLNRGIEP